jgi:tRNA threonylcarbamoyladenosine biosynthesis protein TsaB
VNILAFDTSGEVLSIRLETSRTIRNLVIDGALHHAERLMPEIDEMLKKEELSAAKLDLIVTSRGPGSFTGLRIGMATAKGIAVGAHVPLVSVSTLDAMAWGKKDIATAVLPLIDARKGRFYCALYLSGERVTDYLDLDAEKIQGIIRERMEKRESELLLTGPGADLFLEQISSSPLWMLDPYRREGVGLALARCGENHYNQRGADKEGTGPFYLRQSEAELSRKK